MSDDTEDVADADASEADADGDQPVIEEEEKATIPDDLAEKVEAETTPDTEDTDDAESDVEDAETDDTDGIEAPDGESWGDMYVGTLTGISNGIIEEHGRDGAEKLDESFARQLYLDDAMDEFMASRGRPDMPPEQQVFIGTICFAVAVAGWKTDLFDQLLADADLGL